MVSNITSNSLVSVIMPVYNSERYVGDAIESILNQTYTNFELIIIDDNSTDLSKQHIELFEDKRIRFFSNPINLGISKTRNFGIEIARGKYIAMLDSDDIALPERLHKQVIFLEKNTDFALIGGQVIPIDKDGAVHGPVWKYSAQPEEVPVLLLFCNYIAQSAVMFKKSALPDQWYDTSLNTAEDYELWIRMTRNGKVWNIPENVVKYRVHASGITKKNKIEKSINDIKVVLERQFALLSLSLTAREFDLFIQIHKNSYTPSRQELINESLDHPAIIDDCIALLNKIKEANHRRRCYDMEACDKVIESEKNQIIGLYLETYFNQLTDYNLREFFNAYVLRRKFYRYLSLLHSLKFLIKCMIRFKPRLVFTTNRK